MQNWMCHFYFKKKKIELLKNVHATTIYRHHSGQYPKKGGAKLFKNTYVLYYLEKSVNYSFVVPQRKIAFRFEQQEGE